MRLIIAGSRGFVNYQFLKEKVDLFLSEYAGEPIEIVSGGARGADKLGEQYAKEKRYYLKIFPADWSQYGKGAGYIRNKQMADYATHCICFWDGISKGTAMMIDIAIKAGLEPDVYNFKQPTQSSPNHSTPQ